MESKVLISLKEPWTSLYLLTETSGSQAASPKILIQDQSDKLKFPKPLKAYKQLIHSPDPRPFFPSIGCPWRGSAPLILDTLTHGSR